VANQKVATKSVTLVRQKIVDYKLLVKFRLTMTVVVSAILAFAVVSQGPIDWWSVLILALGGFFVTGASNALNQVLEKDFDKLMDRTADRPLAAGRMSVSEGVMAAGFMSLLGIVLLALFNPWAAFLGMLALLSYAFLYTPLKRVSPLAVTVGAFPGALPTLIGCVAFQGELTVLGFSLFAIQFLWQFPHFWSIGWLGFDDYKKAGYRLMFSQNGQRDPRTGLYAAIYAACLIPVALLPFAIGWTGIISAIIVTVLGVLYTWLGWNLYQKQNRKAALQLMFGSFFYLPLTLIAFFIDKI
jgi:protoheme IX farnesyltransferase